MKKINAWKSYIHQKRFFTKVFMVMKITVFFLLVAISSAFAKSSYSQNTKLSLHLENVPIQQVFDEIQKNSEFIIFYKDKQVDVNHLSNVDVVEGTVDQILDQALKSTDLGYKIIDRQIVILENKVKASPSVLISEPSETNAEQQKKEISGTVKDSKGLPIPGVTVIVKGTTTGIITDTDGKFKLAVPADAKILSFSFVGMKSQEALISGKTSFSIVLEEEIVGLEEVVAVGYGTQRKATLTGAVSAMRSSELVTTKNENVANMLAGKVAGVSVVQRSSEPGEYNNQFSIRGFGTALVVIDGVPGDGFDKLNPDDIADISILKDAAAAVYGVRAANGVVLVTTKTGKTNDGDKFNVNYSYNSGIQQLLDLPSQTTADQYMTMINERHSRDFNQFYKYDGQTPYTDAMINEYKTGAKKTTDWKGSAFNEFAPQQQQNINLSGASGRINYFFGLGYLTQTGFFKTGDLNYNRWNLRANVGIKITNNLSADIQLSGMKDRKNSSAWDTWAVLKSMYTNMPNQPVYLNDDVNMPYKTADDANPVVMTDDRLAGFRKHDNGQYSATFTINYQIPKVEGLAAHFMYNYGSNLADNTDYNKSFYLYSLGGSGSIDATPEHAPSVISRYTSNSKNSLMQLSVDYSKTFSKVHNVKLLALFEESHYLNDNFSASKKVLMDIPYLFAGISDGQQAGMDAGDFEGARKAIVSKLHYDYSNKYLLDFSLRYDGSSKFNPNPGKDQWGLFPSISAGWRISDESFFKNISSLSFINEIKLRGSYGILGDDGASNYQYVSGINYPAPGYVINNTYVTGAESRGVPNLDITWYTAKTSNVGIDSKFFDNKLEFVFDYFNRDRSGLLAQRILSLPGTFGAGLPQENLNSDQTRGFEVTLTYKNKIHDFNYYVSCVFSQNRTRILHSEMAKSGNSWLNYLNNPNGRYSDVWMARGYEGRYTSWDQIYNDKVDRGQNRLPGDYLYQDWNGDGHIDDLDKHPVGIRNNPLVNFGITLGANWKGFDLVALLQGAAGDYKEYNGQMSGPLTWDRNSIDIFWDRWHPADPKADVFDPKTVWIPGTFPMTGQPNAQEGANVHNASYVRIKSLELGYTIPKKIFTHVGIENLRLYVNAYNLFTFTGFKYLDPEHQTNPVYRPGTWDKYDGDGNGWFADGLQYPNNRSFNFGVKVTF
jgi:TonB-linked SusC/RagA family outer membrane protein